LLADWRSLHSDPERTDLAWRYGIDESVLDPVQRLNELSQWLECCVFHGKTKPDFAKGTQYYSDYKPIK
jgi:hypothetical protein